MTTIDTAAVPEPAEERGRRARALLDDPVMAEGFARLEQDLIAAWRGSAPQARETREQLYFRLVALASLRQELRLMAEEGLLAERRRLSEAREAQARRVGGFAAGDPP